MIVQSLGAVDLLVNNAGAVERDEVPIREAEPGEWWDIVEVNVRGPFRRVQAVVPEMLAHGGALGIDVASGSSTRDSADYSAQFASKNALMRPGGSVHAAGYDRGLRAFELAPGVIATEMTGAMLVYEGRTEWADIADVVELVLTCARGDLDAWSGRFLRAGIDDLATLRAKAGEIGDHARTLRLRPYGDDDPLA